MSHKKYFKGCLAWMAASLLLLSCSSSNEGPEGVDEGKAPQWLAVTVNLPRFTQTRAGVDGINNDQPYNGSAADQEVKAARIVLYNNIGLAMYSFDITSTDIAVGSFTGGNFTIKAKSLEKTNYSVLVLVNPTAKVKAVTNKGNVKAEFENAATITIDDLASTANGVLMTNAHGYIPTADANWKETDTEAEHAPVQVEVERSVGKVFVFPAKDGDVPVEGGATVGTATMQDFALDVTNLRTFWMRKPGKSLTGNGTLTTEAPIADEIPTTPHYYQYAVDPNMDVVALTEFNTATTFPQTSSEGGWDDDKGIYVVENTMKAEAQKRNNTTRVLVRLCYKPAALHFDGTDFSWADYRGKLMTLKELRDMIAASATKTDAELKMPQGFKQDMQRLSAEEKAFNKSFFNHNLKFYHQGLNVYATNIRHFDDTKQPKFMGYGRYGVVRNHIYKITVTKVMGPGSPVPPTPDDNPDDNTTTYIAVDTKVASWNTRTLSPIELD